jgi:hypothetical protein
MMATHACTALLSWSPGEKALLLLLLLLLLLTSLLRVSVVILVC